jgi:hypothetical protein
MTTTLEKTKLNDTRCVIHGISWSQFEGIEIAFLDVAVSEFIKEISKSN